jgi:predicted PurR-regulated permease PerM
MSKQTLKKTIIISACAAFFLWLALNLSTAADAVGFIIGLFMPFIVGLCMAFILNVFMRFFEYRAFAPLTRKLERGKREGRIWKKVRRPLSLVITLILVFGVVTFVVVMIIPALTETINWLIDKTPEYIDAFSTWLNDFLHGFGWQGDVRNFITKDYETILQRVMKFLSGAGSDIAAGAMNIASGVFGTVSNGLLGFVFALYILLIKDTLARHTAALIGAYISERRAAWIFKTADLASKIFGKFVAGQCIEAVIIGTLTALGCLFINARFAVMLGVLVGFTALIPVIGAFLGVIVGALLLVIVSPWQALAFIIFVIILQQLEGNLIYPKVVGTSIGLPGIWVMLAVLVGGSIYGILGIIIAVPLTSVIYAMLKESIAKRSLQ